MTTTTVNEITRSSYEYGWHDSDAAGATAKRGLTQTTVEDISARKDEPEWMLAKRLRAYRTFNKKPLPRWGADLTGIDFDNIKYYVSAADRPVTTWEDVPEEIRNTYERLGIPEAERARLVSGVAAQYNSEAVYHSIQEDLTKLGVIFTDTDTALREHEELFREHFGTVIPAGDNKFSALNTAVWSGGSFIYIPPGVHVDIPLQAYFRMNTESMGQFERTLIIVDENAYVNYFEGCTASVYSADSLHAAVVEVIVKKGARCRYTTMQNWSDNVYNLVTKRAKTDEGATMEWVDFNSGCIAEGSLVYTPDGPRKIEDMQVGDQVISFDDETGDLCFRKVSGKKFSGVRPVMEVKSGARRILVTENHPFYAWKYYPDRPRKLRRYEYAWVRADELQGKALLPRTMPDFGRSRLLDRPNLVSTFVGSNQWSDKEWERTRTRQTVLSGGERPIEVTEDIAWLMGLYVGDGYIATKRAKNGGLRYARVTFSVPTKDRAHSRLLSVMKDLCPDLDYAVRSDEILITWSSVELAELFLLNGFEGLARTKRIPEWVASLPARERASFIAGYLDSDGTWQKGSNFFSIKSVNKELINDAGKLLTSLGIPSRTHSEVIKGDPTRMIMGYKSKTNGSHTIYFIPNDLILQRVCPALKSKTDVLSENNTRLRKVGHSTLVVPDCLEVRDVKTAPPMVTARTWDLEIEGTENFICEGFLVHNSRVNMKYPAVWLMGEHAHGEVLSLAIAGKGQHQDTGAKMLHIAPNTSSMIVSKSVSYGGGRTSYRGQVKMMEGAQGSKSDVRCDALLVDNESRSDTYPYVDIREDDVTMGHEATVSKISDEQLFYVMSRGVDEVEATAMIVRGFIEPIAKEFPMEYALELNRLISLSMEGAVG